MPARAGKAPHRALPVKAVLTQLAQGADAAIAVLAQTSWIALFSKIPRRSAGDQILGGINNNN